MAKRRAYRSELIVYADRTLAGVCNKFDRFGSNLSEALQSPQELSAIYFGSSSKTAAFTFERRVNEPFEDNKFFSSATTKTDTHLTLLKQLADTISDTPEAKES